MTYLTLRFAPLLFLLHLVTPPTLPAAPMEPAKATVFSWLDENEKALNSLNHTIWEVAEVGLEDFDKRRGSEPFTTLIPKEQRAPLKIR